MRLRAFRQPASRWIEMPRARQPCMQEFGVACATVTNYRVPPAHATGCRCNRAADIPHAP
jgi:hypothetical protein